MERAEFFADSPNGGYFALSTGRFYTNPDRALFSFELATRIISPRIDGAPVPEPSTWLLLALAVVAFLIWTRLPGKAQGAFPFNRA